MTDEQAVIINKLKLVTLAPYHKRFVLDMSEKPIDYVVSSRQDWHLRRLQYHYRRQLHMPEMHKPADYDDPPFPQKKPTAADIDMDSLEHSVSFAKARELKRLQAWNEGKGK